MSEIQLVADVIFLFLFRIGLPLLVLVIVGVAIERWQRKLHEENDSQRDYSNKLV